MQVEGEIKALSVTNLTKLIKEQIESVPYFSQVIVEGELSNFKFNQSGHLYFTLKDEGAQMPCVMFKSYTQTLEFRPKDGDKVYLKGSIQVYEAGGRYQFNTIRMKEKGIGDLYQKYEELKKKLEQKGYFNKERKRKIPEYPKNIALLTSSTGAVIEDLKSIILKRTQFSDLTLYPMKVQGVEAKFDIVEKIKLANENDKIDVIILARGGGSIEDLWPFNEEMVADAIYNSKKPIISAIGHETDFTISDFVADLRAATPSDAALMVVKDNRDLKNNLDSLALRLNQSYNNSIKKLKLNLDRINNNIYFKDPLKILINYQNRLMNISNKLESLSPINKLKKEKETLNKVDLMFNNAYKNYLNHLINNYKLLNQNLVLSNPLSILDKGYSVTYKNDLIIKDIKEISENDTIETKIKNGKILSKVISKEEY